MKKESSLNSKMSVGKLVTSSMLDNTSPVKPSAKIVSDVLTPLAKTAVSTNGKPIIIQPTNSKNVEKKLDKKLVKRKKTVKVETILTQKKSTKLEDLLVKDDNESMDMFLMRSQYSKISSQIFPKYPIGTFILLGRMGANRAYFGVTFPEDTNLVLDYIDKVIKTLP